MLKLSVMLVQSPTSFAETGAQSRASFDAYNHGHGAASQI